MHERPRRAMTRCTKGNRRGRGPTTGGGTMTIVYDRSRRRFMYEVCTVSSKITVVGRVIRVRPHGDGWRVRLADTGGTLAAAEIRCSSRLALPRVGACIFIHGHLRYDEQHCWHVVDPVTEWREAPER